MLMVMTKLRAELRYQEIPSYQEVEQLFARMALYLSRTSCAKQNAKFNNFMGSAVVQVHWGRPWRSLPSFRLQKQNMSASSFYGYEPGTVTLRKKEHYIALRRRI
jgi:hypothetical protein